MIITKVKVQSINYIAINARALNTLTGYAISLGGVYVCDNTHDEILETINFKGRIIFWWNIFGKKSWN